MVGGLSFCLGPIISGTVVSKIKLSVAGALKFIMLINLTSCAGFVIMAFLGCDKPEWAGSLALDGYVTCKHNFCSKANFYFSANSYALLHSS